jgi:hypothetical protein
VSLRPGQRRWGGAAARGLAGDGLELLPGEVAELVPAARWSSFEGSADGQGRGCSAAVDRMICGTPAGAPAAGP